MKARAGRSMFVAAAQIKKTYVSFHLMPVYGYPQRLEGLSPRAAQADARHILFQLTAITREQLNKITAVARNGIEGFRRKFDTLEPERK